ncbi:MAG: hypothetical protein IKB53_06395 [Oscillospiraceae bacterium]|nr:hypothetical protein [Oscillospiraceae bacterium]
MEKLFGSGINKKVTGKAADSGYNATQTTVPKPQNLFQSNTSATGRQVTGKAADANLQATTLGASNGNYTVAKSTATTPRIQLPAQQNTTQNLGTIGTTKQVTGKAVDSGYTVAKKQASQAANRQTVQNWWNNEQTKSAQDNSTTRAYTAKLTGGANIDNSTEVVKSLQRTFSGANDSAKTQYERTLKSKMGYGRNWGNSRSAACGG